jgi:aspartate/methionine/tyrosine aminotransferase
MFENQSVNLPLLRSRAFNLRWATVPEGVIPLTAADPDFPVAPAIREAIAKFTADGYFAYNDPKGFTPLKEALAKKYISKYHTGYSPNCILPVDSAAAGIDLVCRTYLKPGNEAIIFDPVDFLFHYAIESAGGIAVPFPIPPATAEVDFLALQELITPKTKLICLCNPLNPTGKVFTAKELKVLGEVATQNNIMVLSDEIWSDIVFDGREFIPIASLDEAIFQQTITITGFSKSFGLAGLRVGAVMAPNQNHFEKMYRHSEHTATIRGCNIIGQVAAHAALTACDDWLSLFLDHLHHVRSLLVNGLNQIPGVHCTAPEGCYLAFADIGDTGMTSLEMQQLLLAEAKVSVVPGLPQWFGNGAAGYIRMSFATSTTIIEHALNNITKTLNP